MVKKKEEKIATKNTKEELLNQYVEIKLQMNRLEIELKAKKNAIVNILLEEKDHETVVGETVVSLGRRPTWQYSKKVMLKEETIEAEKKILSMMKKEEEEGGKALLLDDGWYVKTK